MAGTILLEVATPERLMLKETVIEVEVPGADGEMGILPEHAPLLSELGAGLLRYTVQGQRPRCMCMTGAGPRRCALGVRSPMNFPTRGWPGGSRAAADLAGKGAEAPERLSDGSRGGTGNRFQYAH